MIGRFKRPLQIAGVIALLLAIGIGQHVVWLLRSKRTIAITIVDKTVPFENYREHSLLVWLLHALKVTKPDGTFHEEARDYVGYDPTAKAGHDLEARNLERSDALFIADTYGVYRGDYEKPGNIAALERSPKIYGGFTDAEANAIEAFSAQKQLVLGEFNAFASPTEEGARKTLEGTFGARWTRWVGRYWTDLQDHDEVPRWVGQVYERIYGKPFTLTGGGFVFVREDEDMVVLEAGKHLESDVITIEPTSETPKEWPGRSTYWYWLDVLEKVDADVLYEHALAVTPEGAKLLGEHRIPSRFPALLKRHGRPTYYFAGDFVDSGVERPSPENSGALAWRRISLGKTARPEERFLWGWYAPLLESLLEPAFR